MKKTSFGPGDSCIIKEIGRGDPNYKSKKLIGKKVEITDLIIFQNGYADFVGAMLDDCQLAGSRTIKRGELIVFHQVKIKKIPE